MKNLFTSEGRINRAKYFYYHFLAFVVGPLMNLCINSLGLDDENVFVFIFVSFYVIAYLIFITCLMIQRLHDLNRSGIHIFLFMVPIYNIYLKLLILFKKGTDGPNEYGEDPLAYQEIA
ncbi:DUF805 domain-containing protein [Tepidibacter hydrothermalis]|uniref:DUF805 domain-containing protein n=1 Tax=Tepidibacter hydrothermalis TaxID=3036126 RepID=A0ABY8E735_9FIRM|nr:DUF805 domain-containing protein [Tepidibacter hydrothermalis]WFD08708.1 DUF805 domain-containing protein [Tepidibacter hydrothermalis]